MKSKKTIVRVLAAIMVLALAAGLAGCMSSYNNNPIVAKVGNVKLDFNRFYTLYSNTDSNTNPYYSYMQYGAMSREQYADYIIDQLVAYGLQLDQVSIQNITLDEEEEAKLLEDVEEQIKTNAVNTYGSEIDASITDEAAKADAAIEKLKETLKANGSSFEQYKKDVEKSLRESALIEKLRKVNIGEVTVSNDDVKSYFDEKATSVSVTSFRNSFQNFVSRANDAAPLFMPHPERAVEDDPETEDKDETVEADETNAFFSVQHLLMKFANEAAGEDAKDLAAYADKDQNLHARIEEFERRIPELTKEQFLEMCHDKEQCDDPGMQHPANMYFGYLMQTELIDSYYAGFGYACMKLRYGEDWEPKKEEPADAEATQAPDETEDEGYDVEFFTLADGTKIAKVFTTYGAHYIIINDNDCFGMFDDDGYLMVPLYDGDELVKDDEGIVTAKGHMTQEQFDAMNAILENVKANVADVDEDSKVKDPDALEDDEEEVVVDCKFIYDFISNAKKTDVENEIYKGKLDEWKENTKISVYRNIIKPFIKG